MKLISAQYVFTNSGLPLKRAVITANDEGIITNIEETGGILSESRSVEFYNGIIIPGFVNCHCHLELSHMKGTLPEGKGLGKFIMNIRDLRENPIPGIIASAGAADKEMTHEGIVLCADICNTPHTFEIKKKSVIDYLNLLEVFRIDPEKAAARMDEIIKLSLLAKKSGLQWFIVPHSVYSVSLPLLRMVKEKSLKNSVTSIHFMETASEAEFLASYSGALRDSYEASELVPSSLQMPEDHSSAILNEVTPSGNLILVHNTFADSEIIKNIQTRGNTFWCLCPNSNLYIENKLPPVELLKSEGCEITIGTDSLASNNKLSILEELKSLQLHFPSLTIGELISWATINGARALGKEKIYGKIAPGMRPGLLLLENLDLINLKLLPETTVRKLL